MNVRRAGSVSFQENASCLRSQHGAQCPIGYEAIRLAFVAVPLWQAGTLWGTPTGEIAITFLALSLLAAVVPWGYAWRPYVAWPQRVVDARPSPRDAGHLPQSAASSAAQ
jgi:hypothetical protein